VSSPLAWSISVDGEDIVFGGLASWFGGPNDKDDNGQTASGVDNSKYGTRGCALPIPISNGEVVVATSGTPLPALPYGIEVTISNGDFTVTVPLIDVGPALDVGPDRPIDLTPWTFQAGLGQDLAHGLAPVHVRVLGGAKYLPK
jgi:hypothetical protein